RSYSSIVPIQPHGSKPPLYLIHGVGGKVLGFSDLIRHLDSDQPVYGVEYVIDVSKPVMLSLEELAAHYIEEIRASRVHGPYCLLGYSFGGILAFEMARQLQAGGLEVGLLG